MTPTVPSSPVPAELLDDAEVAAGLDRAAALIEADGLLRGELWTLAVLAVDWAPGLSCCTVGALGASFGYRTTHDVDAHFVGMCVTAPPPHPALQALMRYLGVVAPLDVMNWSDARDDREVIDTLRAAAAALRIREAVDADDAVIERARALGALRRPVPV